MNKKKFPAMTLVELIIVIGILSILGSIALVHSSKYNEYLEKQELKSIVIAINQTKNLSLVNRERYKIYFEENSYTSTKDQEEVQLKKLKYLTKKSNTKEFIFTENGRPAMNEENHATAGLLSFMGKKKIYNLYLRPVTGKIRIEEVYE